MSSDRSPTSGGYHPAPLDTGSVRLSPQLLELTERLAEHIHDVWAQQRLKEGWTYGPQRDDDEKRHPGLVAYHALPHSEREYDRRTALEAIKAIVALGFSIDR